MAGGKGKGRARGCVEWRGLGAVMGVWRMCAGVGLARVYVRAGGCVCAGDARIMGEGRWGLGGAVMLGDGDFPGGGLVGIRLLSLVRLGPR